MAARLPQTLNGVTQLKTENVVDIGYGYTLRVNSTFPPETQMQSNVRVANARINLDLHVFLPNGQGTPLPPITILRHIRPEDIGNQPNV